MIEVEVEDAAWLFALPDAEAVALRAAAAVRADGVVAILLTDDETVRDLNARFRGKDAATNVLSFPGGIAGGPLGDIALAFGVCAREASEQGKPLAHHLAHLVAHGMLHLLGFDHEHDDEADVMEAQERRVLQGLGLPDPYEGRVCAPMAAAPHV